MPRPSVTDGIMTTIAVLLTASAGLQAADTSETLWQIGKSDNSTAEFAHAPKDYAKYEHPGFFVVGPSNPKRDWPYVQPGTLDGGWAPGGPQTFEILFALEAAPTAPCRLVLDFVDTHSIRPPKLKVDVNGRISQHQTPKGAGDASVFGEPAKGREHVITIDVPAKALKASDNHIAITTVSGSWVLWDAVRFEAPADVKLATVQARTFLRAAGSRQVLLRHKGKAVQQITLSVRHVGRPAQATLRVGKLKPTAVTLKLGTQRIEVLAPPVEKPQTIPVTLQAGQRTLAQADISLNPVRKWEIHIVHQTHLDIGYTHTQEEVLRRQVQHLKTALRYIEQTKDYPPEARFRWHPEGMWAVEEFMRTASDKEKKAFIDACRRKQIHIDALYAQAMTGMYTEEELFELVAAAKRFGKMYGVPVTSAMQSDVPGYTWGLASALAHNGVPYLSVGPNWFAFGGPDWYKGAKIVGRTHRGGRVFYWADQPFWWVDPSGRHKVLFWMTGWGYSGFHGHRRGITHDKVLSYLQHLQSKNYPYDMVLWRYSIGGDNGPPDLDLAKSIKAWNEKYASPRLIMAGNSEVMKKFAERYGDKIPAIRGDYTPYWEDGSASTSRPTSVNRRACERIAQVQILWAMLKPALKLHERFDVAWHKMIMYDEHTWGAHNSISRPDAPFAVQQDRYKQAYAFDGYNLTNELLTEVTKATNRAGSSVLDVYNTASWSRGSLVLISKDQSAAGDLVKDDRRKPVPSQRLASGELAFVARNVPAFGARRYTIQAGKAHHAGSAKATTLKLTNDLVTLEIEPKTGAIKSLRHKAITKELVDTQQAAGLNDYLYILGRDANKNRSTIQGPAKVTVEDAGPLVATLRIETGAPGCAKLIRRVRIVDDFDHVELINTTDKLKERRPEGVYFGFPFNIPDAVSRIDVPWAVVRVEKDQIRGANRNFYCVQRWVDLSNNDYGVTWVTVDAPMLQFDPIKIAQPFGKGYWRKHIDPGAYIHSWVMNNHWETNYKAYQEGLITFRYVLRPHANGFDATHAQRFGRGVCQPLLAVPANSRKPVIQPLMQVTGNGVVVTSVKPSRDGKATMVRLFAAAGKPERVTLKWSEPKTLYLSDPQESRGRKITGPLDLPAYGIVTLRCERPR